MRLLLYGGTFDPPHNGHLNNLKAAAARVMPDLAVVMPAGVPPHKAASATPAALRLEMCRCFYELEGAPALPKITVSDWEIRQAAGGRRNYTVLTLEMLAKRYPEATLYLAVGSDMLETFREPLSARFRKMYLILPKESTCLYRRALKLSAYMIHVLRMRRNVAM